jgi:hypothetical protein
MPSSQRYISLGELNVPPPTEDLSATYTSRPWIELRKFWRIETQLVELPTAVLSNHSEEQQGTDSPKEV